MLCVQNIIGTLTLLLFTLDIGVGGTVSSFGMKTGPLSALFIAVWSTMMRGSLCSTEVEQHLELGKKLLAAGQLADALTHYHAAVEGDPTNYMTYYKRATVFLALGKSKSALPDLDKVIELKPDFKAARVQRANVKLKQGKLDEAETDYKAVLEKDHQNQDSLLNLEEIKFVRSNTELAYNFHKQNDYQMTIAHLERVIELCPWNPELRELRASCYEAQGDYFKAINDIRPTAKLINDNTLAYFRISLLLYKMGDADQSLIEIRECLKLDPDHKDCFPHYKKVKKLAKQINSILDLINEQRWDDCLGKVEQMLKTEPSEFSFVNKADMHKCHCYSKAQYVNEAFDSCNKVLEFDENNIDALCDRGDTYISNEQFEEAVNDFRKAEEVDNNNRRAQEGVKRAQKLLKQSKKRDYYKILGVKRTARKKDIIKAYRKLAMEWHPDKFPEGDEKDNAQKRFIDIAAAKEVLTNPELRQKFDNGEDPLDAEEQAGGGHHQGFHQGFNPFGSGGGFNFKFNFN